MPLDSKGCRSMQPTFTPPRMYDEFDLADRLRMRGWVLPAYTMCPNAENIKLMRITIREDMSVQMADQVWAVLGLNTILAVPSLCKQ